MAGREKVLLALILGLAAVVFSPSLHGEFITSWDDHIYITENPLLKDLSLRGIALIFSTYVCSNYHPLTVLSNAIEYHMAGYDPAIYHAVNLSLHLINTALVFLFLRRLTARAKIGLIAALFFAIHPMHVESVAWISERKDVLYTTFYLFSLIGYHRYLTAQRSLKTLGLVFGTFLLSLLSKSAAVTLPLALMLLDWYAQRRFSWKAVLEKIPFLMLSGVFGLIAIHSQGDNSAKELTPIFSLFERGILTGHALAYYITHFLFPVGLSIIHAYPLKNGDLFPLPVYGSIVLLALVGLGIWKSGKHRKDLLFGISFFVVTIAPTLQIFPIGRALVAERYSYVPYIGLLLIVGRLYCSATDWASRRALAIKRYLVPALLATAVVFSVACFQRNEAWSDAETLLTDAVEKDSRNYFPYHARGFYRLRTDQFQKAIKDFTSVIQLFPEFSKSYERRGIAAGLLTDFASAFVNRGCAREKLKNFSGAVSDHTEAIALKPDFADAFNNRGNAWYYAGNLESACEDWKKASSLGLKIAQENYDGNCAQVPAPSSPHP